MIYILDKNITLAAQYFDAASLSRMIKDIAQALCNVHYDLQMLGLEKNSDIPLDCSGQSKINIDKWSRWATECSANYLYLITLSQACCLEINYRNQGMTQKQIELERVFLWAKENVPDLPHLGGHPRFGYAFMTEF